MFKRHFVILILRLQNLNGNFLYFLGHFLLFSRCLEPLKKVYLDKEWRYVCPKTQCVITGILVRRSDYDKKPKFMGGKIASINQNRRKNLKNKKRKKAEPG